MQTLRGDVKPDSGRLVGIMSRAGSVVHNINCSRSYNSSRVAARGSSGRLIWVRGSRTYLVYLPHHQCCPITSTYIYDPQMRCQSWCIYEDVV